MNGFTITLAVSVFISILVLAMSAYLWIILEKIDLYYNQLIIQSYLSMALVFSIWIVYLLHFWEALSLN